MAQFHEFLDKHPEIAEQLRKDPSLADNQKFLQTHPALQTFLQDQPDIRAQLRQHPEAFIRQEDAFDRRDDGFGRDDATRRQLAELDQFLDSRREIADQLRKDSSLANKEEFLKAHPEFQAFLQDRPGIRDELKEHPDVFMRQEDAFSRDEDTTHRELAEFNRFLDSHREIAEQLRKDPSLADDEQFLKTHAALDTFLHDQPGIREQLKQNPRAFMRQEDAFERDTRDHDAKYDERMASFKEFLGDHSKIHDELSKDPTLVKNHEYVQNRPELEAYLNAHADVREQLMNNPQDFLHAEQQYGVKTAVSPSGGSGSWSGKTSVHNNSIRNSRVRLLLRRTRSIVEAVTPVGNRGGRKTGDPVFLLCRPSLPLACPFDHGAENSSGGFMNIKTSAIVVLVLAASPLGVAAKNKPQPERAMPSRKMEAVPCGAKERGLSGVGSLWASAGITHVNSDEKLCPQYLLRTDEMEYEVRPTDGKHPTLLPVGHEGEFKIKNNHMVLTVEDGGDRKTRTYEVVSIKQINSDSSGEVSSNTPEDKSDKP